MCRLHLQGRKNLLVEVKHSSETSVPTRLKQRQICEDGILHSRHRENLESYIAVTEVCKKIWLNRPRRKEPALNELQYVHRH
jgi:hypothetical protein